MRVAFLLPTSDMFPALSKDFLNGFKLAFTTHDEKLEFIFEGIGKATDDYVIKTAERLLLQEEVDITVAFCSFFNLKELVDKYELYQRPIIFADLGGSVPKREHFNPFVLHHSLHLCESAYAAGKYAAKEIGNRGALLSSFYDGGYQMAASFAEGFRSNGGEMQFNFVAPMEYQGVDYQEVFTALEECGADVAFTLFSYKEAKYFFENLAQRPKGKLPEFLALPLMTDEHMAFDNFELQDFRSMGSWSFDDTTGSIQSFIGAFANEYQSKPNIFNLLGYEIGLLALHSLSGEQISFEHLKNTEIIGSPRRGLLVSENNRTKIENQFLRKFEYNCTSYHNTIEKTLAVENGEELQEFLEAIPYSGWKNPYICT